MKKQTSIILKENDRFVVTGILRNGKRFKSMQYKDPFYALAINLWRGHVWLVRDNKRTCIKSVWN